jgi:hypothetical protein
LQVGWPSQKHVLLLVRFKQKSRVIFTEESKYGRNIPKNKNEKDIASLPKSVADRKAN